MKDSANKDDTSPDDLIKLTPFMSWLVGEIESTFKMCDRGEKLSYLDTKEVKKYSSMIRCGLSILTLCGTTCSSLILLRHVSNPIYVIPIPIIGIALLYQISKWEIKEASNER